VKPVEHLVLGGAAALALSPVLGATDAAVFWGASVLIDVDHHWDYVWRNGFTDFSLRRAVRFSEYLFLLPRPDFLALNVLHTVEAFAFVALAGLVLGTSACAAALLGMVFHLGLDLARLNTHRVTFKRALSVVEYAIRHRQLRARGFDPDAPFAEALAAICVAPPAPGRRRARRLLQHDVAVAAVPPPSER